ncbi:hypothetical protein BK412_25265 [Vibrio campbellii]|uniref:hypothetical protein n=1 Tax=Vibrio campbellii TaxID=680 RepID=UPI0009C07FC7|nr:hypothetical protein [Vibrio campbellii]OQP99949.1 hypothetical protein BK412_25265 [Vibrio campbellii]
MNVTITLIMYWSISIALIGGGYFALNKGFRLLTTPRSKDKELNTIELPGLKVTTNSFGAFIMMTALGWGWAATMTLPDYKDSEVQISALKREILEMKGQQAYALMEVEAKWTEQIERKNQQIQRLEEEQAAYQETLMAQKKEPNVQLFTIKELLSDQNHTIKNLQVEYRKSPNQIETVIETLVKQNEKLNEEVENDF